MKFVAGILSLLALTSFSWASWAVIHQSTSESLNVAARSTLDANDLVAVTIDFDHLDGYVTGADTPDLQQQVRQIIGTHLRVARLVFVETPASHTDTEASNSLEGTTTASNDEQNEGDDDLIESADDEPTVIAAENIDSEPRNPLAETSNNVEDSHTSGSDSPETNQLASSATASEEIPADRDPAEMANSNRPVRMDDRDEPDVATEPQRDAVTAATKAPSQRNVTTKMTVSLAGIELAADAQNTADEQNAADQQNTADQPDSADERPAVADAGLEDQQKIAQPTAVHETPGDTAADAASEGSVESTDSVESAGSQGPANPLDAVTLENADTDLATSSQLLEAAIDLTSQAPSGPAAKPTTPLETKPDVIEPKPRFGVYLSGNPNDTLVRIVLQDGPAEMAGIQVGDHLVRFGEHKITSLSDLVTAVLERRPGETVPVWIERAGQAKRLEVTLQRSDAPLQPRIAPSHHERTDVLMPSSHPIIDN